MSRSRTDRETAIADFLARSIGRKVYGFASNYASCAEVKGGRMPPDFDRLCAEGDTEWQVIPAMEEAAP